MTLLLAHAAATWFMTGLIWFVQVVHYPLMAAVGESGYCAYQERHMRATTWVVGPAMLAEGATTVGLVFAPPGGVPVWVLWAGLALVAAIWASTAALQVPCHNRLTRGFDPAAHRRLVTSNWLRTALWTIRACLVMLMLGWF